MDTSHQSVPPTSPEQQSFLASRPPSQLSQLLFFRELKRFRVTLPPGQRTPNVPRPQNCAVNGFAEVNWSSTVTSGTRSGPLLRENRHKGCVGSIEASVGGDRRGYLPSTTGVGPVYCFTFGSWNWKCFCLRGLHVSEPFSTIFFFFHLNIHF